MHSTHAPCIQHMHHAFNTCTMHSTHAAMHLPPSDPSHRGSSGRLGKWIPSAFLSCYWAGSPDSSSYFPANTIQYNTNTNIIIVALTRRVSWLWWKVAWGLYNGLIGGLYDVLIWELYGWLCKRLYSGLCEGLREKGLWGSVCSIPTISTEDNSTKITTTQNNTPENTKVTNSMPKTTTTITTTATITSSQQPHHHHPHHHHHTTTTQQQPQQPHKSHYSTHVLHNGHSESVHVGDEDLLLTRHLCVLHQPVQVLLRSACSGFFCNQPSFHSPSIFSFLTLPSTTLSSIPLSPFRSLLQGVSKSISKFSPQSSSELSFQSSS